MKLEYRLTDESVLFHYHIEADEVEIRMQCDYLVNDQTVYERTGQLRDVECSVIYLEVTEEELAMVYGSTTYATRGFPVELRAYAGEEAFVHPLVETREFRTLREVRQLIEQPLQVQGQLRNRSSLEMDEDRGCLVIYML